ncbi:MAG TPA: winged helix-turn-helix domain-containing protein, partial [Blastocatellia bacterium]|nr:winged helix-turn-helix domain-containing protein [Blastocatellia bacterium]
MQRKELYEFDQFSLDTERLKLLRAGEALSLPPKAVELLLLLVERQGQIVEKEFLMTSLWRDAVVEESNLTQNIYLLRKALGKTAEGQSFIETHSKRGYRFVPAVTAIAPVAPAEPEPLPDPLVVARLTRTRVVVEQEEEDDTEKVPNLAEEIPLPAPAPALPPKLAERAVWRRPAVVAAAILVLLAGAGF